MHKSSGNRIHTSLCKQIVSLFSYFQLISTIWLPPAPISACCTLCTVSPLLTFFYWSNLVNIGDIAHCTLSWPSPQTKVRQCTESAKRYCISALYVLVQCTYTENIPDCGIEIMLNLQLLQWFYSVSLLLKQRSPGCPGSWVDLICLLYLYTYDIVVFMCCICICVCWYCIVHCPQKGKPCSVWSS